ncbi:MAG TPA: hypothetical protein VLM91_09115 [Candidatus Methylomirabilis sp.]|nr:hypothetical protein [Candidatus Methylomirabilis sp.]
MTESLQPALAGVPLKLDTMSVTLPGSALVAQVYVADLLRLNLRGILFGPLT